MNNILKELDDFTICLGQHEDDKMNVLFWLQTLIKKVKGKISIINFSMENITEFIEECREKWDKHNFIDKSEFDKRVVVVEKVSFNMDFIYRYAENLSMNDYILLIGGEKLIPYNESKKVINTKFDGLIINTNLMLEEDLDAFCLWLDKIYGDFQTKLQGIIMNIGVDENTKSFILPLLEKSENMSIICTNSIENKESMNYIIKTFYEKLEKCKYEEIINFLDKNNHKLDNKNYVIMLSQVYTYFGLSTKAIELLEENYNILPNTIKKLLADLLYKENGKEDECKKIIDEIFKEDKLIKDLMPSILRIYDDDSDEIKGKWIDKAIEIDGDNPKVIEYYANWLSHTKKYAEAAKIFRSLREIENNQYYEIIARINDIMLNPPRELLDIERYILQSVQDYPELHNEAILRLVIYFREINRSEYITYSLLSNIDYNYNEEHIYKLLNIKLDILSDILSASKALGKLKPHANEYHAKKINIERIKCIIKSIKTLGKYPKGYLDWRRFIDNCQSQKGWSEGVYSELIKYIEKLNALDINEKIKNSFIKKVESCSDDEKAYLGLKLLRRIKTGQFNEDNVNDVIIGLLKYAEIEHNEELKLWARYYASIIYSLRGEIQLANNYALTILEYYNIVSEENKDLCILLGLMSWGNSQFRVGREIEGVICVMSCIEYITKVNEIYPIVEEGLNIVGTFFFDNINIIGSKDKEHICAILKSLGKYNKSLEFSRLFISDSLDELVNTLNIKVCNCNEKGIEWAGDISNLIATYIKKREESKAIELINDNYKQVIDAFKVRRDLRCKLVANWSKILFLGTPSIKNYTIAKELLEIAIKDIESKRDVYHKEERAAIGDISKEIYRSYIEITTIMAHVQGLKTISEQEHIKILESCINKISPRTIIEQKKYNTEKIVDAVLSDTESEFLRLKEEYKILYKRNLGVSEELNRIAFKVEELQNYLKLNHPYYRALPKFEETSFIEIKNILDDNEVFYQYIKLDIMCIEIIITNKNVNVSYQLTDGKAIEKSLIKLDEGIYKDDINIDENICILSKYFGKKLMNHCENNEVKRVYVMPDMSLGTFNLSMCRINEIFLIDKVKSIINILDYDVLKNKECSLDCNKMINRIFGNENDESLKLINSFLQKNADDSFHVIQNLDDKIESLTKAIDDEDVDTLLLYGHGVNDPNGDSFSGSLGIQGKRELIHIENIISDKNTIKNLVLISCRSGVPLNIDLESSTGSWAELFETFKGNIIMCKWDVNTEASIYIMQKIIASVKVNKLKLDEALILAMRETKEIYKRPSYWAGIELWMN